MQAGVFADKDSRPFVMAISTGRFPREELEKFAEGRPRSSTIRAADKALTLEIVDGRIEPKSEGPVDPYALPAAPEPVQEKGERVDVDVSREVDATGMVRRQRDFRDTGDVAAVAAADDEMPLVKTQDARRARQRPHRQRGRRNGKVPARQREGEVRRHAYVDPKEAREQAATFKGDVHSALVRDRFSPSSTTQTRSRSPQGTRFAPVPTLRSLRRT